MTSTTPDKTTPANTSPANTSAANTSPIQLRLLAGGRDLGDVIERDWVLDERTRRIGRYGVLQLRATLHQHRPAQPLDSAVA